MSDSKNKKAQDQDKMENAPQVPDDKKELDEILDQISENTTRSSAAQEEKKGGKDIIKKPEGTEDEPEDIEGMLEKISEKPAKRVGFFQKLLNLFKRS